MKKPKAFPPIVSKEVWHEAHDKIRAKEKALTHEHDALAAERRRLPMVKIDKKYVFDGDTGKVKLLDLFDGRRQLILYHFMFAPGVEGWPDAGCPGCSMVADQIPHLSHLHDRDTSFVFVSLAPLAKIKKFRRRMEWTIPWFSSAGTEFNKDFGVSTDRGENFGLSVFVRDGKNIYRTYFTNGRGLETLGTVWTLLDLTPYGRQETWEDSPDSWPQTAPYQWWRRHDEYRRS